MPDYRLRSEIRSIYEGLRDYQEENGQWVLWYEYNRPGSTENVIYEEGPSRVWNAPKQVPCLFAFYQEAGEPLDDRGLYLSDKLHLTISVDAFVRAGLSAPLVAEHHDNDRVVYEGQTYTVITYQVRGRTADSYTVIVVDLNQVKDDETTQDSPLKSWADLTRHPWSYYSGLTWATLTLTETL